MKGEGAASPWGKMGSRTGRRSAGGEGDESKKILRRPKKMTQFARFAPLTRTSST